MPTTLPTPTHGAELPTDRLPMDRFEDALKGLAITEKRTMEKVAPHLKRFLEASQELQRVLTPLNASVHAAASRASVQPGSATTNLYWVSVFDRVGLFDVDDIHVARLVDAALRYVWRKEAVDALIASVGAVGDRMVAESRRGVEGTDELGRGPSGGTGGGKEGGADDGAELQMMTLPALRKRIAFSQARPPICMPTAIAVSAAKAVVDAVSASKNPAAHCRELGNRICTAYQTFLVARAGLTLSTLGGLSDASAAEKRAAVVEENAASAALRLGGGGVSASPLRGAGATVDISADALILTRGAAAASSDGASVSDAPLPLAAATAAIPTGLTSGTTTGPFSRGSVSAAVRVAVGTGASSLSVTDGDAATGAAVGTGARPSSGGNGDAATGAAVGTGARPSSGGNGDAATGAAVGTGARPSSDGDGDAATGAAVGTGARPSSGGNGDAATGAAVGMGARPSSGGNGDAATGAAVGTGARPSSDADGEAATGVAVGTGARPSSSFNGDAATGEEVGTGTQEQGGHCPEKDNAGSETVEGTAATAADAPKGVPALVFGYLVPYLRTKALLTWRSPSGGKAPAPAGTMANPTGSLTVDKSRSLWCPRVDMAVIKPAFDVPALSSKRLKLSSVPDVVQLTDVTTFKSKSIAEVVGVLLFMCTHDPDLPRIVTETVGGAFETRPSRNPSLVLSGLELNRPSGEDSSTHGVAEGNAGAAGAAAARTPRAAAAALRDDEARVGQSQQDHRMGAASAGAAAKPTAGGGAGRSTTGERVIGGPACGQYGGGDPVGGESLRAGVRAPAIGSQDADGRALPGASGGGPRDTDGIMEGVNVSVEAAYYLRAVRAATAKRASRLSVRRARRAKEASHQAAVRDAQGARASTPTVSLGTSAHAGESTGTAPLLAPRSGPLIPLKVVTRPPAAPRKRLSPVASRSSQSAGKKRKQASPNDASASACGATTEAGASVESSSPRASVLPLQPQETGAASMNAAGDAGILGGEGVAGIASA